MMFVFANQQLLLVMKIILVKENLLDSRYISLRDAYFKIIHNQFTSRTINEKKSENILRYIHILKHRKKRFAAIGLTNRRTNFEKVEKFLKMGRCLYNLIRLIKRLEQQNCSCNFFSRIIVHIGLY